MKKTLTAIALLAISTGVSADGRYDYAQVTDVRPIYETYTRKVPAQECWVETVRHDRSTGPHSATGTVLGGIIGAAVGNELGHKKRNKQVGAVAGAMLGASIGHDISSRGNTVSEYRDVERCETRYSYTTEQRVVAYDVAYRYRGDTYRTRTNHHPGKKIKVAVSVRPVH